MTPNSKVQLAAERAHLLDTETQTVLRNVRSKSNKAIWWFVACWTILFILAIGGLIYQNRIANSNRQHIDCIVKLLATPQKPGTTHKFISNLSECNIKFTT